MSCLKAITSGICIQMSDNENVRLLVRRTYTNFGQGFQRNRASSRLIAHFVQTSPNDSRRRQYQLRKSSQTPSQALPQHATVVGLVLPATTVARFLNVVKETRATPR